MGLEAKLAVSLGSEELEHSRGEMQPVAATLAGFISALTTKNMMLRSSGTVLRSLVNRSQCNWPQACFRCGIATTAARVDASSLPLAGIKVLDMTRVLAGVCAVQLVTSPRLTMG